MHRDGQRRLLPPDEWYPAGDPHATARFVTLPGGERLRIIEAGPTTGTPVLLVHGWGASAYAYRRVLPLLAEAGLRGLAIDLPGHGQSDALRGLDAYRGASLVSSLRSVLDALDWERGIAVGQSMGGGLVYDLVQATPQRFIGAVLLAPMGLLPLRRIGVARAIGAPRWARVRVPRWAVEVQLRRVYGERGTWSERDVDEYWAPLRDRARVSALAAYVAEFDWHPRPGTPAVPVTIVLGERDRLIPVARAEPRARALAGARVRVIPGAGHVLAEEVPNEVAAEIVALVSGQPSPRPAS
ncbi:MAG TPA: alpha/beta hydrolase [Gemmatimonadaceae bacterium]